MSDQIEDLFRAFNEEERGPEWEEDPEKAGVPEIIATSVQGFSLVQIALRSAFKRSVAGVLVKVPDDIHICGIPAPGSPDAAEILETICMVNAVSEDEASFVILNYDCKITNDYIHGMDEPTMRPFKGAEHLEITSVWTPDKNYSSVVPMDKDYLQCGKMLWWTGDVSSYWITQMNMNWAMKKNPERLEELRERCGEKMRALALRVGAGLKDVVDGLGQQKYPGGEIKVGNVKISKDRKMEEYTDGGYDPFRVAGANGGETGIRGRH